MTLIWADAYTIGKSGVNFRKSAGTDRTPIKLLPLNTPIKVCDQVEDVADGYRWILAEFTDSGKQLYGFVAKALIALGKPPITEPPPKKTSLRVGIHFAFSGSIGNSLLVFEQMSRDGYPPPAVLVCSDPGLCKTISEIDKRIKVFYRWVGSDHDPFPMGGEEAAIPVNGRVWYDTMFLRHSLAVPYAYAHVLHNEITFAGNGQSVEYAKRFNQFCMEMMQRATQEGQRVTFGNFMPGVPEKRHIDAMKDSFAYAETNGHWLNYHPYTSADADESYFTTVNGEPTNPYFGLRAVAWCEPYPRLNVLGGEASHFHGKRWRGEADFRTMIGEMQQMGSEQSTELREWIFLYWTARGDQDMNWKYDDITPAMGVYSDESRKRIGK